MKNYTTYSCSLVAIGDCNCSCGRVVHVGGKVCRYRRCAVVSLYSNRVEEYVSVQLRDSEFRDRS
eukprot:scaffold169_cov149-Ochromonas_danica.AAC.4